MLSYTFLRGGRRAELNACHLVWRSPSMPFDVITFARHARCLRLMFPFRFCACHDPMLCVSPQSTESAQPILSDDEDETKEPNCLLLEPDFQLMQALMASQQNFTISDPSMPDNPIVYASQASQSIEVLVAVRPLLTVSHRVFVYQSCDCSIARAHRPICGSFAWPPALSSSLPKGTSRSSVLPRPLLV